MNIQGFHHVAIQVKDLERTVTFYRDVLGLPEQVRHHRPDGSLRSVWMSLPGGAFVALEQVTGEVAEGAFSTEHPGMHLLALRIAREDRPHILKQLQARHIPVVKETRWTVYFRDPEGNRIGLSHHPFDPL